ncbi:MAG: NUDIX domain-containing protein [Spirochaetales bacterium]|nr:NUDIX domain-containing protein [Spirochaetales bacterium]
MKERLRIAAAILFHNESILLGRRLGHKSHPGLWELPGGKIETGESAIAAVEREVFEELGIGILEPSLFMTHTWENADTQITLTAVQAYPLVLPTQSTDHDSLRWVPIKELKKLLNDKSSAITLPDLAILRVLEAQKLKKVVEF